MGFLAVAPAAHIGEQTAQDKVLWLLPQLPQGLGGGEPQGRGELRGFQGQAPQQDRNAVENRGQAEVGVVVEISHRAHHGEQGPHHGDQAAW